MQQEQSESHFNIAPRIRNLTVNDMSTDPDIVAALAAYDAKHKGWDRLLAAVTPVADGAHAMADLGPDLSNDLAEHDSNGEA